MGRQRANGEGAIVKIRAKGRKPYAAVVTVGWSLEGKPIRRARSASSVAEAKMLLREMTLAQREHRPLPDDKLTVGKWLRLWLPRIDVKPNTRTQYEKVARWALPGLGQIPLGKLRPAHVEGFLTGLRDRGYAHNSIVNAKGALVSAIRDAMREGYVTTNAASLARVPRAPKSKPVAPTPDEVRAVLAALDGHRLKPLYVLLAGTGLRVGEAMGLRWEDLDGPDEPVSPLGPLHLRRVRDGLRPAVPEVGPPRALTIRYQLQRINGEPVLTDPKTDSSGRRVALNGKVQAALREQRVRQNEERLAKRNWRNTGLIFTRDDGEPLAASTVKFALDEACAAAGTRHITPHDFRRFAASQVEEAMGREAAQLLLGHTSPAMTARYVSASEAMLSRAAEALEEAL